MSLRRARSVLVIALTIAIVTLSMAGASAGNGNGKGNGKGGKPKNTTTTTTTVGSTTTSSTTSSIPPVTTTTTTTTTTEPDDGDWAPVELATIHPGVQTDSPSGQCTANFVFTSGRDVFIGQAAHCTGRGGSTDVDGCDQSVAPHPIGTQIEIEGADNPGTLVYSSWNAMIASGENDADTCFYNDFALVKIDPADVAKVNPSIPSWGGPNGIGRATFGQDVFSYGDSGLRFGIRQLSPRMGAVHSVDAWSYGTYNVTPGLPGDSGSAVLNERGEALGVLVTLGLFPYPGDNGVTDIARAMAYARGHGFSQLQLVNGTEPFNPSVVNLVG